MADMNVDADDEKELSGKKITKKLFGDEEE